MTTHTIRPRPHLSGRQVAMGLGASAVVLAAAYGVTTALAEEGVVQAPAQELPAPVITEGARDSWEGRIGPDAPNRPDTGVRDSWMPPAATDLKLRMRLEGLR